MFLIKALLIEELLRRTTCFELDKLTLGATGSQSRISNVA